MKKSNIILLCEFFLLIPLTIFLGSKLSGRLYYLTGALILLELLLPYFLSFKGAKPTMGEILTLLVMCALAVIGRVAIPIPNFKATYAVIMLTGIALGAESGFITGAVAALISNFFYGQGAYMPWQMLGYGAAGMLAGFVFSRNRVRPKLLYLALFGFCSVVLWVGPILDIAHLFVMMPDTTAKSVISSFFSGLPVNISQGIATALIMLLLGRPVLEKLDRVRSKYSVTEDGYGL